MADPSLSTNTIEQQLIDTNADVVISTQEVLEKLKFIKGMLYYLITKLFNKSVPKLLNNT